MISNFSYEENIKIEDRESKQYKELEALVKETLGNNGEEYEILNAIKEKYGENLKSNELKAITLEHEKLLKKDKKSLTRLERKKEILVREQFAYSINEYLVENAIKKGNELRLDKKLIIENIVLNAYRYNKLDEDRKNDLIEYITEFNNQNPDMLDLSTVVTRIMNVDYRTGPCKDLGNFHVVTITAGILEKISWEKDRYIIIDEEQDLKYHRNIFNHEMNHQLMSNYQTLYENEIWIGLVKCDENPENDKYTLVNEGVNSALSNKITDAQGYTVKACYEKAQRIIIDSKFLDRVNIKDLEKNDEEEIKDLDMRIKVSSQTTIDNSQDFYNSLGNVLKFNQEFE
ncbi:MAG: hypothetical protein N4A47_07555 [Clostridia bacterium]|nr:hypothetical protein [Clostridia bacterium]